MKPFNKLTKKELSLLYINYVTYRDKQCNGHSNIGIYEYYKKHGVK